MLACSNRRRFSFAQHVRSLESLVDDIRRRRREDICCPRTECETSAKCPIDRLGTELPVARSSKPVGHHELEQLVQRDAAALENSKDDELRCLALHTPTRKNVTKKGADGENTFAFTLLPSA